jgi:antitoxin Phd
MIKIESLISMEQFQENVNSALKLVDEHGKAIILENNKPKYIITKYSEKIAEDLRKDEKQMYQNIPIQSSYKLHEAMQLVLGDKDDKTMHAADLSEEIYSKGLYTKKDGNKAQANQVRARSQNYSNLFEVKTGNMIKLR